MTDRSGELPVSMGSARCTRETPKAILVLLKNGTEHWVPQAAVHDDSEVWKQGDAGKLIVMAWFARKRGWEI
jgi:hypothetical protein